MLEVINLKYYYPNGLISSSSLISLDDILFLLSKDTIVPLVVVHKFFSRYLTIKSYAFISFLLHNIDEIEPQEEHFNSRIIFFLIVYLFVGLFLEYYILDK